MEPFAHVELAGGRLAAAFRLEHLHPVRSLEADALTREMVALITSLEGFDDCRIVLQIAVWPVPKEPERGTIGIHLIGIVDAGDTGPQVGRLQLLGEDLIDILGAPPLRWTFEPVVDIAELDQVIAPVHTSHAAEIVRREEPCQPMESSSSTGFTADPSHRVDVRPLWNLWTLGPSSPNMRRLAGVLLSQDEPVVLRVSLTPTRLTTEERTRLEQFVYDISPALPNEGSMRVALNTIESLLYIRPLFELRCQIASEAPISRALLSSLGHTVSEPARHGIAGQHLVGGFATLRGGIDVDGPTLLREFDNMDTTATPPSLAADGLERLRRLVGPWEAANVFRLPVTDDEVFPGVERVDLPDLIAPVADLSHDGLRVGHVAGRSDIGVMMGDEERFRHLYVSGQTGTGKSTLLYNMALHDIDQGNGVAVIDPHGDLVESLLSMVPSDRIDDVVLIDPADPVGVVGVNLLEAESPLQRQFLVSEIVQMFYSMFDPGRIGIIGPRYESMLRGAANLLLERPERPSSLLDITTLFSDPKVRDHLLDGVSDPILLEFWNGDVKTNRSNEMGEVIAWFRSKFEVFRMAPLVRNVLGQAQSTISFNDILNTQKILLVNLSKGMMGENNSALLGRVIFMRLWLATLERAALPVSERRDFFVYADEFQNMTTDSLPDVLSEARKFRLGLILANQFFTQVPEATRDAIMGNVGGRMTFRLGPKDAGPFSAWMGTSVIADDLTTIPNYHAVTSLSHHGVPLDPFVTRTDAPRRNNDTERAEAERSRSREQWARPVASLDADFFGRWADIPGSVAQGARPHRTSAFLDDWMSKRAEQRTSESE